MQTFFSCVIFNNNFELNIWFSEESNAEKRSKEEDSEDASPTKKVKVDETTKVESKDNQQQQVEAASA